jgi:hypothetical protein
MAVDVEGILRAAASAAALMDDLVPLVEAAGDSMSSQDSTALKATLNRINNANEVIYERVQRKLRGSGG